MIPARLMDATTIPKTLRGLGVVKAKRFPFRHLWGADMSERIDTSKKKPEKETSRTGLSLEALTEGFLDHLSYSQGRPLRLATESDLYMAFAVCRQRKWESEMGIFRGELVTLR